MSVRRNLVTACLWAMVALLPERGNAADDETEARAREQFLRGNDLYERGQVAEAEAAYEEAWRLRPSYDIAGNLGQTELVQGKMLEALAHLRYVLDNAPVGGSKKKRAEVKATYEKALAGVALLQVVVDPNDAQVVVDGLPSLMLPEGLAVEPGTRIVRATKRGYVPGEARLSAKAGERHEVKLTLVQQKVEAATAPTATASSGPVVTPPPTTPDSDWPDKTLVLWAGGGTAAALGITGVVLTVLANGKASDEADARATLAASAEGQRCTGATGEQPACADLRNAVDAKNGLSNGALWTFVGAGVVGLATAGYWFWGPEAPGNAAATKATPFVGPSEAGLWIEGSF